MKVNSVLPIAVHTIGFLALSSLGQSASGKIVADTTPHFSEGATFQLAQDTSSSSQEASDTPTALPVLPLLEANTINIAPMQFNNGDSGQDNFSNSAFSGSQSQNSSTQEDQTNVVSPLLNAQNSNPNTAIPNLDSPSNNVATSSVVFSDENYPLGAGDTVQIQFFNVPEYDGQYLISPGGQVSLPAVGQVSLGGLTTEQASELLSRVYASQLRYPIVTVSLVQRRPLEIVLKGEVAQPGLYVFPSNVEGQSPRLFQALQTAGGVTQAANLNAVEILRRDISDRYYSVSVDLSALLQQGDFSQNIDLRDGDVISIPEAIALNFDDLNQLSVSNLRSQSDIPVDISLVGEVGIPGPYRFDAGSRPTLIQAIQQAGGLSPFADIRQVELRRTTRGGTQQMLNIDLWEILDTGDLGQDVLLQPGDIVKIPTTTELTNKEISEIASSTLSTGPIEIGILGEVQNPGALQVPANTSLSQAILAAGGFNDIASNNIKLMRFNPDGTVTQRRIDIELDQTLNAENNPILRSNDIIMVGRSTWGEIRNTLRELTNDFGIILPFLFFL